MTEQNLTVSQRKDIILSKLEKLNTINILDDSNYKFMLLLISRLIDNHNIPASHAMSIASNVDIDISFVNEDDDFIGDIALTYSDYCGKVYTQLSSIGLTQNLDAHRIRRFFRPITIDDKQE